MEKPSSRLERPVVGRITQLTTFAGPKGHGGRKKSRPALGPCRQVDETGTPDEVEQIGPGQQVRIGETARGVLDRELRRRGGAVDPQTLLDEILTEWESARLSEKSQPTDPGRCETGGKERTGEAADEEEGVRNWWERKAEACG